MKQLPSLLAVCLLTAGCGYNPSAVERVLVVDTPASVKACTKVGDIAGPLATTPGELRGQMMPMRAKVLAMGGNVLLLDSRGRDFDKGRDWSTVDAYAYACTDSANSGW